MAFNAVWILFGNSLIIYIPNHKKLKKYKKKKEGMKKEQKVNIIILKLQQNR